MEKLQFKGFTWPVNPEKYQQKYQREPVYLKDEEGNTYYAGMGPLKLTVTGSGAFSGATAYADFLRLAALCDGVPGGLDHPAWGLNQAFLTELELSQEPRENYVAYRFAFRGADGNGEIPR